VKSSCVIAPGERGAKIKDVGGFGNVELARLAVRADAIPVEDAVGQIAGLLRFEELDAGTDRVQRSGG
jgi:hypothetical protein